MLDQIRDITDQKVLNRLGSKISSGSSSDGASVQTDAGSEGHQKT